MIFLIGLTLNYFPFFNRTIGNLRIMGVLQRIALAYGMGAFISLSFANKNLWKVGLLMLLGYWLVMQLFGGPDPFSLEGNFAKSIDLVILGEQHVYKGFGIPFDPEGLFSSLPAAVTVIFGYLIGLQIKESTDKNAIVKNLLVIGVVSVFMALVWGMYFPINKPLWTSSYVLYAGGIASIILGLLIEFIDIRGYQKWTKPFVVFGMNPLIIYVMSGVIVKVMLYIAKWENEAGDTVKLYGWIYNEIFAGLLPNNLKLASLLFAIFIVMLCWLFGFFLCKKKIFIKV